MTLDDYLEVRCSDVHPRGCRATLRGADAEALVSAAREHGAAAHGYTSVFYDEHIAELRRSVGARLAPAQRS